MFESLNRRASNKTIYAQLRYGQMSLLTCDVREYACYIDYRNRHQDYIQAVGES